MYIWVSNETQGWDVFFDNLSVQHRQGMVIEENRYYPFGLTMEGISDKALKTNYGENKYKYTGKELQNKEFSDGTGLEEYDFAARMEDPQLGVWHSIDPHSENGRRWSPYNYAFNNPEKFVDPDGMDPSESMDDYLNAGEGRVAAMLRLGRLNSAQEKANEASDAAIKQAEINSEIGDQSKIEEDVTNSIKNGDYAGAVDLITEHFDSEFHLQFGEVWDKSFLTDASTFSTDSYIGTSGRITYTNFGKGQFNSFVKGEETFGDLVRNVYHEYQHVQNIYNANDKMEIHEDEFKLIMLH